MYSHSYNQQYTAKLVCFNKGYKTTLYRPVVFLKWTLQRNDKDLLNKYWNLRIIYADASNWCDVNDYMANAQITEHELVFVPNVHLASIIQAPRCGATVCRIHVHSVMFDFTCYVKSTKLDLG